MVDDEESTWKMIYQGWHGYQSDSEKLALLATSLDAVNWHVANVSSATGSPYTIRATSTMTGRDTTVPNELFNNGHGEFSCVYDDAVHASGGSSSPERFKMTHTNSSILVSADALRWQPWAGHRWQANSMDPGFGLFRTNNGTIVATSRPPALRPQGRHAGLHAAATWEGLAGGTSQRVLPVDRLFRQEDQIYGLPVFPYRGMYVMRGLAGPGASQPLTGSRMNSVTTACSGLPLCTAFLNTLSRM